MKPKDRVAVALWSDLEFAPGEEGTIVHITNRNMVWVMMDNDLAHNRPVAFWEDELRLIEEYDENMEIFEQAVKLFKQHGPRPRVSKD